MEDKIGKGRPPKFKSPDELNGKIKEYYKSLEYYDNGAPRDMPKPPTIAGLAHYLGFASRQSIFDYLQKGDDFSYIIKRAKLKIEEYLETKLSQGEGQATGSIFLLKANSGYKDKQEVIISGNVVNRVQKRFDGEYQKGDE